MMNKIISGDTQYKERDGYGEKKAGPRWDMNQLIFCWTQVGFESGCDLNQLIGL